MIAPPSATEAVEAVSVTMVASASSVTLVETVLVVLSASKLPPVGVPLMETVRVSVPCRYASSVRTVNGKLLAVLALTGMVMVWPLDRVTTSALPVTRLLRVAV